MWYFCTPYCNEFIYHRFYTSNSYLFHFLVSWVFWVWSEEGSCSPCPLQSNWTVNLKQLAAGLVEEQFKNATSCLTEDWPHPAKVVLWSMGSNFYVLLFHVLLVFLSEGSTMAIRRWNYDSKSCFLLLRLLPPFIL